MKTKRYKKQALTPRVQQRQTLYYTAAGIALAMVVGILLFFYLNIGHSDDTYAAPSPPDYSILSGFWSDNSIWNSGVSPGTSINGDVEVLKNITSLETLELITGNLTLRITDTLVVHGDLTIGNNSNLIIGDNGVLVVTGNLTAANKLEVASGGIIAVGGNANFGNNLDYTGSGDSELFVLGSNPNPEFGPTDDPSILESKYPQIFELLGGTITTLPITLKYFRANVRQHRVQIDWETESEIDNNYFEIERSTDGQQYEVVGTVDGAGTSTSALSYSWTDESPWEGVSYYRLRQTDFDGQQKAFDWVAVTVEESMFPAEPLAINRVFPNPVVASCSVEFTRGGQAEITVQLLDMQGNVVASQPVEGYQTQLVLDNLHHLRPGTYLLRLVAGKVVSPVHRVIKE